MRAHEMDLRDVVVVGMGMDGRLRCKIEETMSRNIQIDALRVYM